MSDDDIRATLVESIRAVETPGGDPIEASLVADVDVTDGVATIAVDLESTDAPMATRLTDQLRGAGLSTPGVEHVRVRSVTAGSGPVAGASSVVLVGGAKGGVGRTTVTVSLARTLAAAGVDVGVFDADVHCPDATRLLEATGPIGTSPTGRPLPVPVGSLEVLSVDLAADDPVAWRGAMVHDVLADLLERAAWDDRDVVLVDLPPGLGQTVTTVVQRIGADGAVLVTTPTVAGGAGVERAAALFDASDVPLLGVVANETAPTKSEGDLAVDLPTEPACRLEPVPFDLALVDAPAADALGPAASSIETLARSLESAVVEADDGLADAVDLRGLPPSAATTLALAEIDAAGGDPVTLAVETDPAGLVDTLDAADGRRVRVRRTERIASGWTVELAVSP